MWCYFPAGFAAAPAGVAAGLIAAARSLPMRLWPAPARGSTAMEVEPADALLAFASYLGLSLGLYAICFCWTWAACMRAGLEVAPAFWAMLA